MKLIFFRCVIAFVSTISIKVHQSLFTVKSFWNVKYIFKIDVFWECISDKVRQRASRSHGLLSHPPSFSHFCCKLPLSQYPLSSLFRPYLLFLEGQPRHRIWVITNLSIQGSIHLLKALYSYKILYSIFIIKSVILSRELILQDFNDNVIFLVNEEGYLPGSCQRYIRL